MADMIQETEREKEKFNHRMEEIIRAFLGKGIHKGSMQHRLAEELLKLLHSKGKVTTFEIPDDELQSIERFLIQKKIPHISSKAINGMNLMIVDASRMAEIQYFQEAIKQLSPGDRVIADPKMWFDIEKQQGENSSIMMRFENTHHGKLSEADKFKLESIKDKLYGAHTGHSMIYSNGITGYDKTTGAIDKGVPVLATRLAGAANADKNKPDLVQAILSTSVDSTNFVKQMSKGISKEVDNKQLEDFIDNIKSNTSAYCLDALHPNKTFLEYNANDNAVYFKPADSDVKVRVLDGSKLDMIRFEAMRDGVSSVEKFKAYFSGAAGQIFNMKCVTPKEKGDLDLMSDTQIADMRDRNNSTLIKALEKNISPLVDKAYADIQGEQDKQVEQFVMSHSTDEEPLDEDSPLVMEYRESLDEPDLMEYITTHYTMDDFTKNLDVKDCHFDFRPDFSSEDFLKGMAKYLENYSDVDPNIPIVLAYGLKMNAAEDILSEDVSRFVNDFSQQHASDSQESQIKNIISTLRRDAKTEDGVFKDFCDNEKVTDKILGNPPSEILAAFLTEASMEFNKKDILTNCTSLLGSCEVIDNKTLEKSFKQYEKNEKNIEEIKSKQNPEVNQEQNIDKGEKIND